MRFLFFQLPLSILAQIFRCRDSTEKIKNSKVRIFIPASYSTKENEPALATTMNLYRAIELASACDGLIVLFSCSHPFEGAAKLEDDFKREILIASGVRYIMGRSIINSIDEMEAVKEVLEANKIDYYTDGVCLITCDFHSRAMRLLAQMILKVRILVFSNSYVFEVEEGHPTPDQRTWVRWLPLSLARLVVYEMIKFRITSFDRWRNVRHKGKHE